ncbi:MAG: gliding motility-associated ABC transporter substrate-binding protein GldG [Mariniphaga sp.]|nr:gliding motility-associated ABC transporter substrate-binding protein GldG [Mariniphaga sp.]MDD4424517.1 gliding motility-associated ABC transporter substrate-binding protein GldG [Mariniphaga sp.]
MYSLFKKELKTFFGSLVGYIAILTFLLITGLFLWIFPGAYNIPDSGYATLEGFFSLAPWLYLFLVPAITMRLFADEKRTGTLEILLTRPLSDFQLIFAKFAAGMVLVLFSLLPTLLYFLSVFLLGNPVGSIDTGATWGSFFGLFFLAAIYVAIGIFASSLTDNQIVSFILAMVLSFVFYLGFDFIASTGMPYLLEQVLEWMSINNHYVSISRGVIDLRDMVYFMGMTILFLWYTRTFLRKGQQKQREFKRNSAILTVFIVILFIASGSILYRFDLTSDKRYSLSAVSSEIAGRLEQPVEIELFLAGKLEPGLRKLQREVIEKVAVLNVFSPNSIRIKITDLYEIPDNEKREKQIENLIDRGIRPTSFRQQTDQGISTRLIFPGAIIYYNGKESAINFLKYNPDFSHEMNFNHSAESVEFELVNTLQKLMREKRSTVAFLEGHGEADRYQVYDLTSALTEDFRVKRIHADSLTSNSGSVDILVVADPQEPFLEKDKYFIDQFIMHGGKIIWLIDPVQVSSDSLSKGHLTLAFPRDLNLNDQLFHYGVRLNYELLQDVECARIRVNTAPKGSQPAFTLHPWYYSPLLVPSDNHSLSKNLNRLFTEFVASIDTVSGDPRVKKSVILTTSPYARKVKSPSTVSLQNIDNPPARELFNQSFLPVAVLLEGTFTSVFKNRMTESIGIPQSQITKESQPTKQVVIADGGLITNLVDYSTNPPRIQEAGFDRVSGHVFGNKEFILNIIYYLNDDQGIMHLRSRTQKLRLLDKVRLREEIRFWQWLNVFIPLILVGLWGISYNILRKSRYTRS